MSAPSVQKARRILIVDDEESQRFLMAATLAGSGFEVIQATGGVEGIELAESKLPDLIISDVNMPDVDGYEVLQRLRSARHTSTIPFILMTGAPKTNGLRQSMERGADDYLPKPFDSSTLLAAVETRLNRQRDLERHAEEIRSRLLGIVAATSNFVAMADAKSECFTYLNPAARSMMGLGTDDDEGKWSLQQCFRGVDDASEFRTAIETAKQEGHWSGECCLLTPAQREIPLEMQLLAHASDGNGVVWLSIVAKDLRETMQLRQAQKMEAIGRLAAGIAHEINTPTQYVGDNIRFLRDSFQNLTAVLQQTREMLAAAAEGKLNAELIAQANDAFARADVDYLIEQIPAAVSESLEGVSRISGIVRAMKDFSHPGAKTKSVIDINKAIDSTVMVARNEWKYVAELKLDLESGLPKVPCFVNEFNQAVLNLIVNGAHAIGEVVSSRPGSLGTITIQTRRRDPFVEIRISDTGKGIPESIRPRIFEPFFTTKEIGKGTGQGLAMVYSAIVKQHDGYVRYESTEGKGTTFILGLPIAETQKSRS